MIKICWCKFSVSTRLKWTGREKCVKNTIQLTNLIWEIGNEVEYRRVKEGVIETNDLLNLTYDSTFKIELEIHCPLRSFDGLFYTVCFYPTNTSLPCITRKKLRKNTVTLYYNWINFLWRSEELRIRSKQYLVHFWCVNHFGNDLHRERWDM